MAKVIVVNTPGPQGKKGDIGQIGPQGSTIFQPFSGSAIITGSLYVTSTISGSLLGTVTGSLSGSVTGNVIGTSSWSSNSLTASVAPLYVLTNVTSSFINTSSFNNFTSSYNSGSFTGSFIGSLIGTSSWAQNSTTSSTTILSANLLTNQTVGGVSSGTTFNSGSSLETILRTILVTYIPPTLSSLTVRSNGSTISTAARDVGNSFTINSSSFSATADNPTGIFPLSASFTGSSADIGTFSYYFGNNVLSTSNVLSLGSVYTINKATSAGSVSFTVNGRRSDTGALITGANTSISFQWRNYLAASSTIPTDNATAQTVVNAAVQSVLDSDRVWTATCTAANNDLSNYTYIIYPASYGDLTNIIRNGASLELGAFEKLGDFTITNAYSATILVRIYKSNYPAAYSPGDSLAIS